MFSFRHILLTFAIFILAHYESAVGTAGSDKEGNNDKDLMDEDEEGKEDEEGEKDEEMEEDKGYEGGEETAERGEEDDDDEEEEEMSAMADLRDRAAIMGVEEEDNQTRARGRIEHSTAAYSLYAGASDDLESDANNEGIQKDESHTDHSMVEAVVLYDYVAQEPDELNLKKGDVITKIQTNEGGWWEGTLNKDGKRGLFPDNFVRVISTSSNNGCSGFRQIGKKYRVKFSYTPVNADELELNVNDVVEFISEVEEGWWEGKLKNKIGVFPSNFVVEVNDSEICSEKEEHTATSSNHVEEFEKMDIDEPKSPKTPSSDVPELPPKPKPVKETCVVLFPYEAKHEDELTLKENDVIMVLSTDLPDKGWWKGQLHGKIGVFPDNFVKLISVGDEISKPKRPSIAKTTNKTRDNVSKQTNSTVAALRKSLEPSIKLDENITSSKKPTVSKKPNFTQTTSADTTKVYLNPAQSETILSPERSLNSSKVSLIDTSSSMKSNLDGKSWTETSPDFRKSRLSSSSLNEKLNLELQESFSAKDHDSADGIGASKSYEVNSDRPTSSNVGETVSDKEVDFNVIERSEILTHPTASRVKAPKRRPPSGINFKEEEILSFSGKSPSNAKVTVNGIPDINEKMSVPWLQELKMNQVKKSASQVNIKTGFTSSGSNVTFRFQRPVSMFSGEAEAQPLSFQAKTSQPSNDPILTVSSSITSDKVVTISASDWNALNDKVNNLEVRLEMQNDYYKKTIEQLKLALVKEIELRLEMKKEMDKLMDLVTQV